MSEGVIIALIGLVGAIIAGIFAYISLKATLKNNRDLALIAAGQVKTNETMEKYHKEVNSKMTELLQVTGEAEKAKGVKEGRESNQAETDAKTQDKK